MPDYQKGKPYVILLINREDLDEFMLAFTRKFEIDHQNYEELKQQRLQTNRRACPLEIEGCKYIPPPEGQALRVDSREEAVN